MIHKGQPGAKNIASALMMVPATFREYFELQCKLLKKEDRGQRSDLRLFASSFSFPSLLVSSAPGHLESTVYSCTCSSPSLGKACLRHRRSKPSILMVWTSAWTVRGPAATQATGAPKENIVQNHLNIALLNVF